MSDCWTKEHQAGHGDQRRSRRLQDLLGHHQLPVGVDRVVPVPLHGLQHLREERRGSGCEQQPAGSSVALKQSVEPGRCDDDQERQVEELPVDAGPALEPLVEAESLVERDVDERDRKPGPDLAPQSVLSGPAGRVERQGGEEPERGTEDRREVVFAIEVKEPEEAARRRSAAWKAPSAPITASAPSTTTATTFGSSERSARSSRARVGVTATNPLVSMEGVEGRCGTAVFLRTPPWYEQLRTGQISASYTATRPPALSRWITPLRSGFLQTGHTGRPAAFGRRINTTPAFEFGRDYASALPFNGVDGSRPNSRSAHSGQ